MSGDRPFILGLTGSIGMGKTTTAGFFWEFGVPVWDADAAVHRLYAIGGAGVAVVGELVPDAIAGGAVDRRALKKWLAKDAGGLAKLEAIVHPLVAQDRAEFLAKAGAAIVVLDIPLLFETGGDKYCDATLVVSAPPEEQQRRVLARKTMTEAQFQQILAQQMPDAEKRKRADYVIKTTSLDHTRHQVKELLTTLQKQATKHA